MPTPWEQKRAAIAAALAGGNPPSVGAGPMVNPMISAMSPMAPGIGGSSSAGSGGLMGATPTQGQMMAQANASLQGAPGFNYVPPQVGPPPPPPAAAPAPGVMTMDEVRAMLLGGPGASRSGRGGSSSDRGGYSTSGGYGGSSSGRSGII